YKNHKLNKKSTKGIKMDPKMKKISILTILAVIVLVALMVLTSCSGVGVLGKLGNNEEDSAEDGIEIFELETGDIIQLVATTGSVDSSTQNYYTLQVSGEIISAMKKGDYFKEGDLLVELDNSDAMDQLEQIEMDILDAESSLRTARMNYQSALDANHIAIQLAELNTEGAERSTQSALVSLETANRSAQLSLESAQQALENAQNMQDVESAENTVESVKSSNRSSTNQAETSYEQSVDNQSTSYWNNLSSLQSAETQIAMTAENIKQTELVVEAAKGEMEDAEEGLQDYKFFAPYNGVVLSTDFRMGEQANESTLISLISDEFIVKVTISENDIFKISEDNEALITFDSYSGLEFNGRVIEIIPISVNDGGIISYEVLLEFETGEDIDIYYGLSANASIITQKAENILYVPIQSVYKEDGKSYVDLLTSFDIDPENILEAIEQVEVTTGINDYLYIEVISGLKEGDIIVTSRIK
ncbi:MAG: HlyD family efflux transporter periplasmic adaptor subunit, partial [Candidatus Humimicrobiaceae bacterium]